MSCWIVCQIGAREHYAIPRALQRSGNLGALITDFWVPSTSVFSRFPGGRRLSDRFHADLDRARVFAPNLRMLGFEIRQRIFGQGGWPVILKRDQLFQQKALAALSHLASQLGSYASNLTLFSYSYAALDLFRYAKGQGWTTVLGQIDPGPEEERIVAAEHKRYSYLHSSWRPAPASYWASWREEVKLADKIIVNSDWSRSCLINEGVAKEKLHVVPLVYGKESVKRDQDLGLIEEKIAPTSASPIPEIPVGQSHSMQVLFLGQINLRKGVGRLLDAMRLLKDEPIELVLAGPSDIQATAWADLPKVRWVGPVPRSEVGRHYEQADLFILPTLSDGYALTQLEALSHGLPVIASRCCGEAVKHGENGWLLEDIKPETIASAFRLAMRKFPVRVTQPKFSIDDLGVALIRGYL